MRRFEHVFHVGHVLRHVSEVMGRSPGVEPAGIELAAHQRAGRLQLAQPAESARRIGAEVDHLEQVFAVTSFADRREDCRRTAGRRNRRRSAPVRSLPIYSASLPNEPYSFSTCTMRIGPPLVTCSGPSTRPISLNQAVAAAMKADLAIGG